MKLGLVTYNLAKDWDVDTIIENCSKTGFEAVEPRTTHAHGIEVSLSASERQMIKRRFEDSPVDLTSLGSAFQYDAIDPDELRGNIEGTKEYVLLARDLGAAGVKVRPNKLHDDEGVPMEKTIEQIGLSLRECAAFAADVGVEIRLEIHGVGTSRIPIIRQLLDAADSDNLFTCWNCNKTDHDDGGVEANFKLVSDSIRMIHTHELHSAEYPYKLIFGLLGDMGFDGYCCAEIPESGDALELMHYYHALFEELKGRS